MKKEIYSLILLLSFFSLASCGSPESAGEKAAEEIIKCEEAHSEQLQKQIESFINSFNKDSYQTRSEAWNALTKSIEDVDNEYKSGIISARQKYEDLSMDYVSDYKNSQKFYSAYQNKLSSYKPTPIDTARLCQQARQLILTIIPPDPNKDKVMKDLVGRSWQDSQDGYFGTDPKKIREGEVREIEIKSNKKSGDKIDINAELVLQQRAGGAAYKINADISYLLGDADDWMIDNLHANSVEIIKTNKYNDYIKVEKEWVGYSLNNNSDAPLLVGGIEYDSYYGWKKFAVTVDGNSSKNIFGSDIEIHFVERP